MIGMRSKTSKLRTMRKRTQLIQSLQNVKKITNKTSKSQTKVTMPSRKREEFNRSKCRQCQCQAVCQCQEVCQCQQAWQCPCQRMSQGPSHSHQASLVSSICQFYQARWVKDRCQCLKWCRQQEEWYDQASSPIKECRSYQANNSHKGWISSQCRCRHLKICKSRKNLNLKVGAMSWLVQKRKVKKLSRSSRKSVKENKSSNGRIMVKKKNMVASRWISTTCHKELMQMLYKTCSSSLQWTQQG